MGALWLFLFNEPAPCCSNERQGHPKFFNFNLVCYLSPPWAVNFWLSRGLCVPMILRARLSGALCPWHGHPWAMANRSQTNMAQRHHMMTTEAEWTTFHISIGRCSGGWCQSWHLSPNPLVDTSDAVRLKGVFPGLIGLWDYGGTWVVLVCQSESISFEDFISSFTNLSPHTAFSRPGLVPADHL